MKLTMTGLPPLVEENQTLLANLILRTMYFSNFKVDGVHIEFKDDENP